MNNPKIQMSSAQTEFSRAGGEQLEETTAREGCSALSCHHLIFPPKKRPKKGQSSLGGTSKAANWRSLGLHRSGDLQWNCRDLYLQGLVGETCQGFLNDNHSSFLFASPHPSPCQEFVICCSVGCFFFFFFWF